MKLILQIQNEEKKLKIIIYISALLLTFTSGSFSQSIINYQPGTSIEVQSGAAVCADTVIISGTFSGGGTICGLLFTLNLTAFIEGFYNPVSNIMVSDTVKVFLRNKFSPYAIVDSTASVLNSSGSGTFTFSNPINGLNYYIELKHRNSIETWSSSGHSFTSNTLSYNFSTANTQAFGNNMKLVDASPVTYAIYSGDVNQDGFVNLTDVVSVYNGSSNFITGYVPEDVNGDNIVDLTDLVITYNNSSNFVSLVRP